MLFRSFNQQEIDLLNHIAKTFEEVYITQEKKLKDWLETTWYTSIWKGIWNTAVMETDERFGEER